MVKYPSLISCSPVSTQLKSRPLGADPKGAASDASCGPIGRPGTSFILGRDGFLRRARRMVFPPADRAPKRARNIPWRSRAMETTTTARPPPRKDRWLIVIGLAIVAMVIAGVIVAGPGDPTAVRLPFRAFSIPSTSMEPTLRLGEYAFANMRAYGGQDPERGDIVILTLPRDPSTIYVKRGVGLAGEKLQMKNGVLQINGQAVPTESAGTYKLATTGQPERMVPLKRETLPNGVTFDTLDLVSNGFYDNTPVFDVPAGKYF